MEKVLRPRHDILRISGSLSYSEGHRAWNIIRLKHDLLKEFPQLKERREKFSYKMVMHRSFKEIKDAISKIEKEGGTIPIFLFLCRK